MSTNFVFQGFSGRSVASTTHPHLALRVQKEYSFTLTTSSVNVPCFTVQFAFTYSSHTISSPTNIWPIPPKTRRLQTCEGLLAGRPIFLCHLKQKCNVRAIPNFVNIRLELRGIPSRLTDLHTAARETDRHPPYLLRAR